ncbi:type II toxin-antitoxin system MqsA family antitoxin [Chitinilyticum litopenaei]|uniref:type II toxin-antitoxin system MqsA family antitoxin n=1 Tax=Chitinilyticum litopenaei TaxID=1121276 RepID=UPI0009DB84A7|nr:type II toxin-antitoxin system MqsA family antitoxin [Chitinilyticum litopenaei]
MSFTCPHCGDQMHVRSSRMMSESCKETYYRCRNKDCGAGGKAHSTIAPLYLPATYATPEFVTSVRKKLNLTQQQADEILACRDDDVFADYESGKIKPPRILAKLLKLLDRHPELLDEIKNA